MALDTSIYNALLAKPKTIAEYDQEAMTSQSNRLAMQMNQAKMGEYQRGIQQENALAEAYRGSVGADGKVDRNKLFSNVATSGLGSKLPAMQKSFADADETAGKVSKQKVDLLDAKLKQSREYLATVKTPEEYLAWHEANHRDPVLGPELASRGVTAEQARASIMAALQQPGGFEQLLQKSALGIEKFTEMNKPTVHVQNLGGTSQVISTPGLGGPASVLSNTPITQSEDSKASAATARRGQDISASTAAAGRAQAERHFNTTQENNKGQIVQTDNGPVLVNTRTGQGQTVNGPDGQPLAGVTKQLNDSQSKALLFGTRMQESHKILNQLGSEGTGTSVPGARAPLIGGVVNYFSSDNHQMLEQAKRDFMTAVLRRESGASISDGEYDNADKQYFPQQNEGPKVIAQKARNRELAIRGILAEVPEKQRGSITPGAPAKATPAKADIHALADAILNGSK